MRPIIIIMEITDASQWASGGSGIRWRHQLGYCWHWLTAPQCHSQQLLSTSSLWFKWDKCMRTVVTKMVHHCPREHYPLIVVFHLRRSFPLHCKHVKYVLGHTFGLGHSATAAAVGRWRSNSNYEFILPHHCQCCGHVLTCSALPTICLLSRVAELCTHAWTLQSQCP